MEKTRSAEFKRKTKETDISCKLTLDGEGIAKVDSKIGFFDHMLNTFAKHGHFNLELTCDGDLSVDTHHSVEDTGIVMGTAFNEALSSKEKITRYASFTLPMDDALVMCAVDLCGRAYYGSDAKFNVEHCGDFETETTNEFFRSFAEAAKINLHFVVYRGDNAHHIIEAMFKAFANALHLAIQINADWNGSLTTKGVL